MSVDSAPSYMHNFIIVQVAEYLSIWEKLTWMSVCKQHWALITNIRFNEPVYLYRVAEVSYKVAFTNLYVTDVYPRYSTIDLGEFVNLRHLTLNTNFQARVIGTPPNLISVQFHTYDFSDDIEIMRRSSRLELHLVEFLAVRSYIDSITKQIITVNDSLFIRATNGKLIVPEGVENIQRRSPFSEQLILPNTLKTLGFGAPYQHDLILSDKISYLYLMGGCRGRLHLPTTLQELIINKQCLTGLVIPEGLKLLEIWSECTGELTLPKSLHKLYIAYFGTGDPKLPDNLKELTINNRSDKIALPDSIENLMLRCNVEIVNWPISLVNLIVLRGYPYAPPFNASVSILYY